MLRIYKNQEYKGSINDDICICIHQSKNTEPDKYIILQDNKAYLGIYPRMQGHRNHGKQITIPEAEKLLEEKYLDEPTYQKLIQQGITGITLIQKMRNS